VDRGRRHHRGGGEPLETSGRRAFLPINRTKGPILGTEKGADAVARLEAVGVNDTIVIDGDILIHFWHGTFGVSKQTRTETRYPLSTLVSVNWDNSHRMMTGSLNVAFREGGCHASFTNKTRPPFLVIRDALNARLVAMGKPSAPQPGIATHAGDTLDALERLAALRDRGVLTDDEFASQKAVILAG
jgi:putative oligomerization/nucleic acid binding protein